MAWPRLTSLMTQTVEAPRAFDRALLVITLLMASVALASYKADPDLWGHVQYGRDAIREGLPRTTTYSYTAQGYLWINHENLAELLLAVGMDTIGPTGLLIAKSLLGLLLIGSLIYQGRRQRAATLSICVIVLLVAANLTHFWHLRPQLITCLCLAGLLFLLAWCFEGWEGRFRMRWLARRAAARRMKLRYQSRRMRFLWIAPVILLIWTNSHGGFVAGWCILTAYLGLRSLEALSCRGWEALPLVKRFLMIVMASALVTLLNPYGPRLHLWLLHSLGTPRPEILEWRSPDLLGRAMLPLWAVMATWLGLVWLARRPRDVTHQVILALTLWQTLSHQRHLPFFVIPFGFWMVAHLDDVLRRFGIIGRTERMAHPQRTGLRWGMAAAAALAVVVLSWQLVGRLRSLQVEKKQFPVAAFQYMADRNLHGKLVVTYNWAQYAIAAFGHGWDGNPGMRVSFDGRFRTCYPQYVVDMNFDFVLGPDDLRYRSPDSPPFDDQLVLEYGQPDLVLIHRFQPHSVDVMQRNRDRWILLYQDEIAQLWGRRTRYGDPAGPDYIAPELREIGETKQTGMVAWPALPVVSKERRI